MKCDEIRDRMPDVAAGFSQLTEDESNHLASCNTCAEQLKAMQVNDGSARRMAGSGAVAVF